MISPRRYSPIMLSVQRVTGVVDHRTTANKTIKVKKIEKPLCAREIVQKYRQNGNKLGVPDMRKHMKAMVAEIFYEDKYSPIHKCRGIWKGRPAGWDPDVSFCDPNNSEDGSSNKKPSRQTLTEMMRYLVGKAEEKFRMQPVVPVKEPQRQTDDGNPWEQSSDWCTAFDTTDIPLSHCLGDLKAEIMALSAAATVTEENTEQGAVEEHGTGVAGLENMDCENMDFDNMELENMARDLVNFVDNPSNEMPQQAKEEGGSQEGSSPAFCNTQACYSNSDQMEAKPVTTPILYTNPPATEYPPPNNQVQGCPKSNSGELGTIGSGSWNNDDGEDLMAVALNAAEMESFLREFSDALKEPDQPTMEGGQSQQLCAEEYGGATEEANLAQIPTVVQEMESE